MESGPAIPDDEQPGFPLAKRRAAIFAGQPFKIPEPAGLGLCNRLPMEFLLAIYGLPEAPDRLPRRSTRRKQFRGVCSDASSWGGVRPDLATIQAYVSPLHAQLWTATCS